MFESKLDMAKQFGATDVIKADDGDPVAKVFELTEGRGADTSFEVIGLQATMEQAINVIHPGGEVILVGVPRLDVFLNLNAAFTFLYMAKTVKGCWYGSSNVNEDVPKLIQLYKDGQLDLEGLISREIDVDPGQRGLRRHGGWRGRPLRHHLRVAPAAHPSSQLRHC